MTTAPKSASSSRDDIAYVAPFAVFMFFTTVVGSHEGWYPISYYLKTAIVAAMLWYFWPRFTRISWKYWWLGVIAGVIGVVQWVGMEKGLLHVWPNYPRLPGTPMDPFKEFARPAAAWTFIAYRWMGATLLVPVMEELFWRDFLYRQFIAPNDFKMAEVGEYDGTAFLLVAVIFGGGVHIQWATAIVYGLGIGGLLVYTRSLGACIICHAVTNFLLGGYVLWKQDWYFW